VSWERRGGGGALVAARGGGGRRAGWGGCAVAGFRGERTPAVRKEALPFPEPPWHPASGTDGLCQNPPPPLLYRPDASRGAGRSPGPGRPKAPQVRPVQARAKLREGVPAAALAARARGRVRGARGGGVKCASSRLLWRRASRHGPTRGGSRAPRPVGWTPAAAPTTASPYPRGDRVAGASSVGGAAGQGRRPPSSASTIRSASVAGGGAGGARAQAGRGRRAITGSCPRGAPGTRRWSCLRRP